MLLLVAALLLVAVLLGVFPEEELLPLLFFATVPDLLGFAGFLVWLVPVSLCGLRAIPGLDGKKNTTASRTTATAAPPNLVGTFNTLCFLFQPTHPL